MTTVPEKKPIEVVEPIISDTISNKKVNQNLKQDYNKTVKIDDVAIKLGSSTEVKLDQTTQEVIAAFGNPVSTGTYFIEMLEKDATVFNYNGIVLKFIDNKLYSFLISNSNVSMRITNGSDYFKVGDDIWDFEPFEPYYQFLDTEHDQQTEVLSLYILNGSINTDAFVYIKVNPIGIITELSIRNN